MAVGGSLAKPFLSNHAFDPETRLMGALESYEKGCRSAALQRARRTGGSAWILIGRVLEAPGWVSF
jgi:hypothetical protein